MEPDLPKPGRSRWPFSWGRAFFWSTLYVLIFYVVWYAVIWTLYLVSQFAELPWFVAASYYLTVELVQLVLFLCLLRFCRSENWGKLTVRAPLGWRQSALVAMAIPALCVVFIVVDTSARRFVPSFFEDTWPVHINRVHWIIAVIAFAFIPALYTELWFRGFIGQALIERYGLGRGLILGSGMFALVHLDPPSMIIAFIFGGLMQLFFSLSGTLWMPILLNAFVGSFAVLSLSDSIGRPPSLMVPVSLALRNYPFATIALSLFVLAITGYFAYRFRHVTTADSQNEATLSGSERVTTVVASIQVTESAPEITDPREDRFQIPLVAIGLAIVAVLFFITLWTGKRIR